MTVTAGGTSADNMSGGAVVVLKSVNSVVSGSVSILSGVSSGGNGGGVSLSGGTATRSNQPHLSQPPHPR